MASQFQTHNRRDLLHLKPRWAHGVSVIVRRSMNRYTIFREGGYKLSAQSVITITSSIPWLLKSVLFETIITDKDLSAVETTFHC